MPTEADYEDFKNGLRILARMIVRAHLKDLARAREIERRKTMPIKGLSEVVRLPRLGKIRLGVKKENAEGIFYPESTDYFVCPDEVKDVFGEKPKELRIMFPTDDETQWASQFLRCYSADGSLVCRGDGEMALARVETNTNEPGATTSKLIEMPCSPFRCPCHQQGYCRRVMNLQFLLPDCPGFGVYQLDTGSLYSIININSSLKLIRGICGRLSMIPLSLKLIEQDVLPEGKKKTIKILSLTAPYSIAEIQKYAQIPPGQALLLPVPDSEAPDDLFPPEILKQQKPAKQSEEVDKRLINLWTRVKSKVWQMDMQDYQVSHWFQKNCNLDVHITDFDLLTPPNRIKAEYLENFLKTLERYTDRS